jgi:glutaredoxin
MGLGRRCDRHGLAAGPDGMCALCRSESLPPPRPYASWVLGGLAAAILAVTGGVVAYRAVVGVTHAAIAREPERVQTNEPASIPEPAAPAPAATETPPGQGESIPFNQPLPPPVAPAFAAAPSAKPAPPSAASAATAAPLAPAPERPAPSPSELQAAFTATPIVMYSASWCGVCRNARRFFAENGLRVQEIDVDQTPGAWEKVQQQTGRRAVPLIIVDGYAMAGLSPDGIMRAVASSMERRLGVTGITFKKG